MIGDTTGATRLPCPYCGSALGGKTISTIVRSASERVRRRKECRACGERWSTNEVIDLETVLDDTASCGGMQAP